MKNTNKVILVVLDGLNADVGLTCMGFLQALCEQHKAKAYKLQCELPSLSRPLYECILTGVAQQIAAFITTKSIVCLKKKVFSIIAFNQIK